MNDSQWREGLKNSNTPYIPNLFDYELSMYVTLLMKIQKNPENPENIESGKIRIRKSGKLLTPFFS